MLKDVLIIIACVCLLMVGIILFDSNRFRVVHYHYKSSKLKKKLKIAFLSDLHGKHYGEGNFKLFNKIEEYSPDLILIGGDMIVATKEDNSAQLKEVSDFLKRLSARYNVVYALGNHEERAKLNEDFYGNSYRDFEKLLNEGGIKIYDNESVELNDLKISCLTIPRSCYKHFDKITWDEAELKELSREFDAAKLNVLLAHNPDFFKEYCKYSPDVILSGHNHGGVVRIPFFKGVFSPRTFLFPKYDGGKFSSGNTTMYVSRGLGSHTIPLRAFNPAELVCIDFEPQDIDF